MHSQSEIGNESSIIAFPIGDWEREFKNLNKGFEDLESKARAKEDLKNYISEMSQSLDDLLKKFAEREAILRD